MSIGDRMKNNYELPYLYQLPRRMPVIIRIDGRCFHTLSKRMGWKKPFDDSVIYNIQKMTIELCREVMNTKVAYMQSDEISFLLIDYEKWETQPWFNDEVQKITSVIAGLASSKFTRRIGTEVTFDARVFVIPPLEVNNYFIWRQQDATRNSIQALAQTNFSPKELKGLSNSQLQEKLWKECAINWNKLSIVYRRGSCVLKKEDKWVFDSKIPEFNKKKKYINQFVPEMRR